MNNYVTLDSYRYKTKAQNWNVRQMAPSNAEILLNGDLASTFGPVSVMVWTGSLIAPMTPESAFYGDVDDLRTTLLKRTQLTFTDHYGDSYTVHLQTRAPEKSKGQMWDSDENEITFDVIIRGTA